MPKTGSMTVTFFVISLLIAKYKGAPIANDQTASVSTIEPKNTQ